MKNHISIAFKKFKDDAFSKAIYDIIKWLVLILIAFLGLNNLSYDDVDKALNKEFTISRFYFILTNIGLVLITLIITFLIYRKKYKKLEGKYFTDDLTGLDNQELMKKHLSDIFTKNDATPFSFILIDIDNFKMVNERIGYHHADEVLKKIAIILKNELRIKDKIFRFHQKGDEFLICLNNTTLDNAKRVANRLKDLVFETVFEFESGSHKVTLSSGVTTLNNNLDNQEILIERLNSALRKAKAIEGKNSIVAQF